MCRVSSIVVVLIAACVSGCRDTIAEPAAAQAVESVRIVPFAAWLHPGDTLRLTALPIDADGAPVTRAVRFTWRSALPSVAIVDSLGLVTAVGLGDAELEAAAEGERGTSLVHVLPEPSTPAGFRLIVAGDEFTCGVEPLGVVFCWGRNTHGQLGNGRSRAGAVPTAIVGTEGVRSIAAGTRHACIIDGAGRPWCWGWNSMRQVGPWFDDKIASVPEPAPLSGPFREVAAGSGHTCALREDGTAFCWGANLLGQLGADPVTSEGPVQVGAVPPLTTLVAGHAHTCGLDLDGNAWCWGWNAFGQLGAPASRCPDGDPCSSVPLRVKATERFRSLAAGADFTCGLGESGVAFCWGANAVGQLGGPPGPASVEPVRVGSVPPLATLRAGRDHACGLTAVGALYCWGDNRHGQLGDGSGNARTGPVLAHLAPLPALLFAGGGAHSCATNGAGVVTCWGENAFGQLGLSPAS